MNQFENDLPATPEPQRSAEKKNSDQEMVQPINPSGQTPDSTQPTTQPPAKSNGSAGSTETPTNIGGGIFDPARWKTPIDAKETTARSLRSCPSGSRVQRRLSTLR